MHIPDGFIAPAVYLPAYGVAAGLWAFYMRKLRRQMNEQLLPWAGMVSAFSFLLMSVALPLPGGSTAHATGVPLLAMLFGVSSSFLLVSIVLFIQALVIGDGGVTALGLNALIMGFAGSMVMRQTYRIFRFAGRALSVVIASFASVMIQALLTASVLGVQPIIAADGAGNPLFFPFGLKIVLPVVLIPHIWIGIAEGVLTVILLRLVCQRNASISAETICPFQQNQAQHPDTEYENDS